MAGWVKASSRCAAMGSKMERSSVDRLQRQAGQVERACGGSKRVGRARFDSTWLWLSGPAKGPSPAAPHLAAAIKGASLDDDALTRKQASRAVLPTRP